MSNEDLLQELAAKLHSGEITREEVLRRLPAEPSSQSFVTKMLYALGAVIVIVGIVIFVSNIWNDIGSGGRITVTLGLGLLLAAIGSVLLKEKPEETLGALFHFIGGTLIPGGAVVVLRELDANVVPLWPAAITFGLVSGFYLLLTGIHKHPLLMFFALVNGTAFLYLLVAAIVEGGVHERDRDLYAYLTMTISASYLLLAQSRRETWNKTLIAALCFLGSMGFQGAAFSQVFDSTPWRLLYFLIVLGGQALSVYMKSKNILVVSTLFLIAHVSYITGKYFADSLGWPISLVILGFAFIGLGYASVTINKKYISGVGATSPSPPLER